MWRHYVYVHLKKDTNEVFYVGKGSFRKDRNPSYERAFADHSRNRMWKNTVKKHGFKPLIFVSCETDTEAQRIEKLLISEYGRKDLKRGSLVNFTDGGDGHCGLVVSEELRAKRARSASGQRSDAWIRAIRKARKNGGNGGVVKKGDKLPCWWKDKIAAAKLGEKNPMYGRKGKNHPMARRIFDAGASKVYESVEEAATSCGYKMKTLYNWLSGHRKNPTNLRFI